MKVVKPLDYVPYDKEEVLKFLESEFGWEAYKNKHYENVFTRFYEGYYLPVKFNYDKRKCYLSSLILSGQMTRDEALEELRQKVGIVMQKSVLFAGTIRENLRWGKADATDEELYEALQTAHAREVVEGKAGKLDAPVEQGGKNFSGGQRQRLTIARALVRKPEILILDDSASALDYATDARLRLAIRGMKEKPTVFIVSQRTSSIQHADKIIVLDDGEIAGMGTHEKLLCDCAVYREIYDSQYKKSNAAVS